MGRRRNLFDRRVFGRAVKDQWQARGIGVRSAAKEIGISPATLSRVARGNSPSVEVYLRLVAWLDARKEMAGG